MSEIKRRIGKPFRDVLRWAGYDVVKRNLPSNYPPDFDDFERKVVSTVSDYTMTPPERIVALIRAVRYIVKKSVPGPIVECGVWRGGSMMAVAITLLEMGETDRDLYLFDTYEGMTPPGKHDVSYTGITAKEVLSQNKTW